MKRNPFHVGQPCLSRPGHVGIVLIDFAAERAPENLVTIAKGDLLAARLCTAGKAGAYYFVADAHTTPMPNDVSVRARVFSLMNSTCLYPLLNPSQNECA